MTNFYLATIAAIAFTSTASFAQIPVIDKRHLASEAVTAENTKKIEDTNNKQLSANKSVTCAVYRGAKGGPSAAAARNPEIVGLVKRVAREEGVNEALFLSLVYQESKFNPCAKSSAGAYGLAQLMPGTAKDLGVNPHNIESNLRGGARYLKQQLKRFGSIPKALAAYNAGPGNVRKYGGIPPFKETRGYVANITQKWLPIFSGGAADKIPLNYGTGNSYQKGSIDTINGTAFAQATQGGLSNVASWLKQQSQTANGTLQESFDQNSGIRQSNIAMINKFLETANEILKAQNTANTLTTAEISGSSTSTQVEPLTDTETEVVSGQCDDPNLGWDEDTQSCLATVPELSTAQTNRVGGTCEDPNMIWDEQEAACVVNLENITTVNALQNLN